MDNRWIRRENGDVIICAFELPFIADRINEYQELEDQLSYMKDVLEKLESTMEEIGDECRRLGIPGLRFHMEQDPLRMFVTLRGSVDDVTCLDMLWFLQKHCRENLQRDFIPELGKESPEPPG